MSPFLEMTLEGSGPPVAVVTADLALVLDVETVKLVQPVGDRLACPVQRHLLRVVDRFLPFLLRLLALRLLVSHLILHLRRQLFLRPRLLLLHLRLRQLDRIVQKFSKLRELSFKDRDLLGNGVNRLPCDVLVLDLVAGRGVCEHLGVELGSLAAAFGGQESLRPLLERTAALAADPREFLLQGIHTELGNLLPVLKGTEVDMPVQLILVTIVLCKLRESLVLSVLHGGRKVNQRLGPLEEVDEVGLEGLEVVLVLHALDVEGDGGEVEEDIEVDLVGDSPRVLQVDELDVILVEVQEPPMHLFSRELVEDLRVVFKGDILVVVRLIVQVGELAMVLPQLPETGVESAEDFGS
mmetsp:Transcript_50056/g.156660  ORF Transcript_50056/g.156660 Transcript_50056/m.156660 type:complete len:353 (+) Transcript_50056:260-1318(+)